MCYQIFREEDQVLFQYQEVKRHLLTDRPHLKDSDFRHHNLIYDLLWPTSLEVLWNNQLYQRLHKCNSFLYGTIIILVLRKKLLHLYKRKFHSARLPMISLSNLSATNLTINQIGTQTIVEPIHPKRAKMSGSDEFVMSIVTPIERRRKSVVLEMIHAMIDVIAIAMIDGNVTNVTIVTVEIATIVITGGGIEIQTIAIEVVKGVRIVANAVNAIIVAEMSVIADVATEVVEKNMVKMNLEEMNRTEMTIGIGAMNSIEMTIEVAERKVVETKISLGEEIVLQRRLGREIRIRVVKGHVNHIKLMK